MVVQLCDAEGRAIRTDNFKVEFEIEGEAELLGVNTGAPDYNEDFQTNSIVTDHGRYLAIIRSTTKAGMIKVTAKAEGLEGQRVRG